MKPFLWICISWSILFNAPGFCSLDYEILWQVKGELGFSGPNEIRDKQTGKTVGIVVSEIDKGVVCFDGQGKNLWQYALSPQATAYPAVGDVDGDGHEDIVSCGGSGELVVLDLNGKLIWANQTPAPVIAESCPAIADLNGDGYPEILVGDSGGYLSCFDCKGNLIWCFRGEGSQMGPPLIADIYDPPGKEIIITSHDNHIYALSAKGKWLWDIYQPDDLFPNSTPLLADVNGDRHPELYIGGGLHHFYRIDLKNLKIELKYNTLLHVNSAIAATDIDGDGKDEIIFGNKGGTARCYDDTGFIWKQEFQKGNMSYSPIVTNLDQDPDLEIMFLFRIIHALDSDGTILLDKNLPNRTNSPPLAGDFNNDGLLETVIAGYGGQGNHQIVCLQWNIPYQNSGKEWSVFTGSRSHAGFYSMNSPFIKYQLPKQSTELSAATFSNPKPLHILSGRNDWQFDIRNPEAKRLILSSHIQFPDGSFCRFANHVRSANERVGLPLDIKIPGDYELNQELIDADTRTILSSKEQKIGYQGLISDKKYLNALFDEIESTLASWQNTNPDIVMGMQSNLLSLKGTLHSLEDEETTYITEYMPQMLNATTRLHALVKAGCALAPAGSFIAWEFCPWAYFDSKTTLPNEDNGLNQLSIDLCVGEFESLALNITNLSTNNQEVRVIPDKFNPENEFDFAKQIQLRRAVRVPTLESAQIFDALPKLDQAQLISIPPLETQQLWITVNAKNISAGDYITEIKLKNLESVPTEVTIPLHIKVYKLTLPHPRPLRFCVWAYDADWPDYEVQDLVEHGVTVHFGIPPQASCTEFGTIEGEINFSEHDASVKRLARHGILLFLAPQNHLKGQPFLSDPWQKAFIVYLRAWVAKMKELGLEYHEWALYPYDEPSTPYANTTINLVKVARLVRQADPNILIYTDPTSGTNESTLEMFKGLIDIWCPSSELLERFGDKIIPFAKKHGKELWFYDAAGKAKTLSPLGIYRWRFWYAWNIGFTGAGWWTYSYGDNCWDGPNDYGDYWSTIYKSPGSIVTSKRWEISREGIEDYELLYLLNESIKSAQNHGYQGHELKHAETVIQELPKEIEKLLFAIGRRIPLNNNGVPQYLYVTNMLQDAKRQIIDACIKLNEVIYSGNIK